MNENDSNMTPTKLPVQALHLYLLDECIGVTNHGLCSPPKLTVAQANIRR